MLKYSLFVLKLNYVYSLFKIKFYICISSAQEIIQVILVFFNYIVKVKI